MTVGLTVVIALAAVGLGGALGGLLAPRRYRSTSAAVGLGAGCLTPIAGLLGSAASLAGAFKLVAHVSADKRSEILAASINDSMASTVWGIAAGVVVVALGALAFALNPRREAEPPPAGPGAPRTLQ
jgi:hypothetical protein